MTAINRIGLWFTIIGGNLWGGIIARYGGKNVALEKAARANGPW
jgi:hypothetical protein